MDCEDARTLDPYDFCKDGEFDEEAFDAAYAAREEYRISRLPPTHLTDEMLRYIPDREDLPPRSVTVVNLDAVYGDDDVPDEDVATEYEWYNYRGERCEAPETIVEVFDRVSPSLASLQPPPPSPDPASDVSAASPLLTSDVSASPPLLSYTSESTVDSATPATSSPPLLRLPDWVSGWPTPWSPKKSK